MKLNQIIDQLARLINDLEKTIPDHSNIDIASFVYDLDKTLAALILAEKSE